MEKEQNWINGSFRNCTPLIREVDLAYEDYEPTKASRAISEFVQEKLSNWYVRLCRRRFWKGEYGEDKIAAYQTLYECLTTVSQLAAPVAPFYMDRLYQDLNPSTAASVHLTDFPVVDSSLIKSRTGTTNQYRKNTYFFSFIPSEKRTN